MTDEFCGKCHTDKTFLLDNFPSCIERCSHPFDQVIDPATHITDSTIEYRSKQIEYYNFLVDEECRLNISVEPVTTCFVQNWNEQSFMKLRTQNCETNRNIVLVALFSIYTLIPFILVNQNRQTDSCREMECKWSDSDTPVCPEGCYCAGENCASKSSFQEKIIYEQERLFHEFTLCPTWAFPTIFFLDFIDHGDNTGDDFTIPENLGGIDSIYGPIISSLHTMWRNTLNKNPDTSYLFGLYQFPGHIMSYCLGKNGLCEIFDSNGSNNLLEQPDGDNVMEVLKYTLRKHENISKVCKLLSLKLKECYNFIVPIIHQILSLAMSTFRDTPNTFFVRGIRLNQRWPVVINKSPLRHGGSCGMWSVLYLFFRALMSQFGSIRLQNVFTKLTDESSFECLYIAPFKPDFVNVQTHSSESASENVCNSVDQRMEPFCSSDIGRVFWFALFKAFQYCVGTKPAAPKFFLQCAGDADTNPGGLFVDNFCVIRDLLPEDVKNSLGCGTEKGSLEFYPPVTSFGRPGFSPVDQVIQYWSELFLQANPYLGGDGIQQIIKLGLNILKNPTNPRYRSVKMENRPFKKTIGSLIYGMTLMKAVGFTPATIGEIGVFYMEDKNLGKLETAMAILENLSFSGGRLVARE